MPSELTAGAVAGRRLRVDLLTESSRVPGRLPVYALMALLPLFVLWGGTARDLNAAEAMHGMAAGEPVGPYGQALGGWVSSLTAARMAPSWLWVRLFGDFGTPTAASVLFPATLAALALGAIPALRMGRTLGTRAGILTAFAILGSIAVIDRSAVMGFDALAGLMVVAALDRVIARGSDWVAGLWAALAVLAGGWPALAMILLPILVLGRQGSYLSWRLLLPPAVAFAGWSAWALQAAPALVWGESLTWPLKRPTDWRFAGLVLAFSLPWSPFALLAASRPIRATWEGSGRTLVLGWLQVAGVAALAGTLLPGFAPAAFAAMLVGLAVTAAAALDRVLTSVAGAKTELAVRWGAAAMALIWAGVAVPRATDLAATVPFYRAPAILLIVLTLITMAVALVGAWEGRLRWAVGVIAAIALGIKLAHATIVVPEFNYRFGQGPWGRAVGQWIPPRWPLYIFHPWRADLMFSTEHPVRMLVSPKLLQYEIKDRPVYVLLQPSEFSNWPKEAPKIQLVREFLDEHGFPRLLARTEGDLADLRLMSKKNQ